MLLLVMGVIMKYTVEMASDGMTDIRKGICNFRNWRCQQYSSYSNAVFHSTGQFPLLTEYVVAPVG
jgi:hypothetical protein